MNSASINSSNDVALPYIAGAPVANAIGAEIGLISKDSRTGQVQRTGVGFYIRSDHAADCKYDLAV